MQLELLEGLVLAGLLVGFPVAVVTGIVVGGIWLVKRLWRLRKRWRDEEDS